MIMFLLVGLPVTPISCYVFLFVFFLYLMQVRRATGTTLAHTTQLAMTLVVGTIIGLAFSWQIGKLLLMRYLLVIQGRQLYNYYCCTSDIVKIVELCAGSFQVQY